MIERVEALPGLAREAAPDVADAVERELQQTIAAGTDAYGKPWPPTKEGGRPLQHAAAALTVVAVGTTVITQVSGPEARHHLGRARGGLAREIIPTAEIPPSMNRAIKDVLGQHFARMTGNE